MTLLHKWPIAAALFIALCFSACDRPEQVPAYLNIESYQVNSLGGAAWHKVTDVWVYINGEFLGAYPLPARIPVLAEGNTEVIVFAGIKENGIAELPGVYPIFDKFTQTYNLTPSETTTVVPVFKYDPAVTDTWLPEYGTFDALSSVQIENRDGDIENTFEITTNGAFEGKSLKMAIDTAHATMEIVTEKNPLPTSGGQEIWLEMHYKNDVPFSVFVLGTTGNESETAQIVYLFNPTENNTWNKIYLNLTAYVSQMRKTDYRLFFRAQMPIDDKGKYVQLNGTVLMDNLRLVHY